MIENGRLYKECNKNIELANQEIKNKTSQISIQFNLLILRIIYTRKTFWVIQKRNYRLE
jgi:hypothetical protein